MTAPIPDFTKNLLTGGEVPGEIITTAEQYHEIVKVSDLENIDQAMDLLGLGGPNFDISFDDDRDLVITQGLDDGSTLTTTYDSDSVLITNDDGTVSLEGTSTAEFQYGENSNGGFAGVLGAVLDMYKEGVTSIVDGQVIFDGKITTESESEQETIEVFTGQEINGKKMNGDLIVYVDGEKVSQSSYKDGKLLKYSNSIAMDLNYSQQTSEFELDDQPGHKP